MQRRLRTAVGDEAVRAGGLVAVSAGERETAVSNREKFATYHRHQSTQEAFTASELKERAETFLRRQLFRGDGG